MSACLFVTSNWTDMVSLYREAFHTPWEGLKLFRGRLQPPSKIFWIFITSVAVYSLYHSGSESYPAIFKATIFNFIPVLQCRVCTILDHNLLLPYLWQPFWIFTCVAVYSLYHSGSESSPAIFAAAMLKTYVSLSNTLNVHNINKVIISSAFNWNL